MSKLVTLIKDGNKINIAVENSEFLIGFGWEVYRTPIKTKPAIATSEIADKATKGVIAP